jgi:hypothetical protein
MQGDVLVVTLNVPGGSNNDQDIWYWRPGDPAEQAAEAPARTAATLRWLDQAFKVAESEGAKAVMIVRPKPTCGIWMATRLRT